MILLGAKDAQRFVRKLEYNGFDLNTSIYHGNTLLHLAAMHNCPQLVEALVKAGADVDVKSIFKDNTPLHTATLYSARESVIELLNLNASRIEKNACGDIPLHMAVSRFGLLSGVIQRLIPDEYDGSDDSAFKNNDGISPQEMCLKLKKLSALEFLKRYSPKKS